MQAEEPIKAVQQWLENIVLKYNFCPFAHKPFKNNTIRYYLSTAIDDGSLIDEIIDELLRLKQTQPTEIETTLIIIPQLLHDFAEYNQFAGILDSLIASLKLKGIIQVATFHPDYQFADLSVDDVRNYTNRSPYPIFHLIREDSVEKARATYPNIEEIPEKNMQTLLELGIDRVRKEIE